MESNTGNDEDKRNENDSLIGAVTEGRDGDDNAILTETNASETDSFSQSLRVESNVEVNDESAGETLSVEAGPQISQFLKEENHANVPDYQILGSVSVVQGIDRDHTDTPDNQVLDSASVVHGVGHMLRNARESRNLSVEEVSRQLKISVRQVKAIESESFDSLPGRTFVRGFVRNYASLMQLDVDAIIKLLPGPASSVSHVEHTPFTIQEMKVSSRHGNRRNGVLIGIALLSLLAALVYFFYDKLSFPQFKQQSVEQSTQPKNEQTSVELALPLSPLKFSNETAVADRFGQDKQVGQDAATMNTFGTLTLNFTGETHVKVTDGNEDIVFEQNNLQGTQQRVSGRKPMSIVVSDAAAVEVIYNDRSIDIEPFINSQSGSAQFILE